MIGRLTSKSMLSRLEALEKQMPSSLSVFYTEDGIQRRLTLQEFIALPTDQRDNLDLSSFHITGGNLREFDQLLDALIQPCGLDKE